MHPAITLIRLCLACALLNLSVARAAVYTSFSGIAEPALGGVVNIRTTTYVANKNPSLDLYQFFLKGVIPRHATTHAVGSGVIISKQGHILTNHHVIENARTIEVLFSKSKRKLRAEVIGVDPKTDLALLKVNLPAEYRPLDLGDSDTLRVGDIVLAIGNPFGYAHTVTSGIISAKGRVIGTGPYDDFLQTDASIHPGNSGGPLIDIRGRVVGIATAVAAEGPGIGFAIPVNLAKIVARDLQKFGKVRRPWLGVIGKNILTLDEVDAGTDPTGVYGVIVTNLIVDGPAQKAGLKIGDLIMGFDDNQVEDLNHLQRFMMTKAPSDRVRLKYYRRGKGFSHMTLGLEEMPKAGDLPTEKDLL